MVIYHLSRAEKWVFSHRFQAEGKNLRGLSRKNLLFELSAVYAGKVVLFNRTLLRRQRKFIQACFKIKDSCSPGQQELIIRLATDNSARSPLPPEMVGSHPECEICEHHCCYTGIYHIEIDGEEVPTEDCPFLNNNCCQVYDIRPEICRNYLCGEILNLPRGYTLGQLISEYYGDCCEGLPAYGRKFEKVIVAIPAVNVDATKQIHLAHGKNRSYQECPEWEKLRDLQALEMKMVRGSIQYIPI